MRFSWDDPRAVILSVIVGIVVIVVVILAIGVAVGIAGSIIAHGLGSAVGATLAWWLVSAAAISVTATVTVGSIWIFAGVTERVRRNPYNWALPVLALVAGLFVDLCKSFTPFHIVDSELGRIAVGALTSALFVIAGILWQRPGLIQWIAALLFLVPPIALLVSQYDDRAPHGFLNSLDAATEVTVLALVVLLVLTMSLAWALRDRPAKAER